MINYCIFCVIIQMFKFDNTVKILIIWFQSNLHFLAWRNEILDNLMFLCPIFRKVFNQSAMRLHTVWARTKRGSNSEVLPDNFILSIQYKLYLPIFAKYLMKCNHKYWHSGYKTTEVFPGKIMIVKLTLMDRLKFILSSRYPSANIENLANTWYQLKLKSIKVFEKW